MQWVLQLCRGQVDLSGPGLALRCLLVVVGGAGLFGFAAGMWRSPLQGVYAGLKLPVLLALTVTVNGLLNGIAAKVLGSGLGFRETLVTCGVGFSTLSVVLAAFSPVLALFAVALPGPWSPDAARAHSGMLLGTTAVFAYAGVMANVRTFRALARRCPSPRVARRVLAAWLVAGLVVGAQLSWNLRPWLGNPDLEVRLLRPDPFAGSFYEDLFDKTLVLFGAHDGQDLPDPRHPPEAAR